MKCKPLIVEPLSVTVVPGVSVTIALPTMLNTEVGTCYTLVMCNIQQNHTGTEEVIVTIDGLEMAAVDNCGVYVTSQMLHNPDKFCPPLQSNVFRIQIIATDATVSMAFRRGLARRKTTVAVVTPPQP